MIYRGIQKITWYENVTGRTTRHKNVILYHLEKGLVIKAGGDTEAVETL